MLFAAYEVEAVGRDGTTRPFGKPWFLVLLMFAGEHFRDRETKTDRAAVTSIAVACLITASSQAVATAAVYMAAETAAARVWARSSCPMGILQVALAQQITLV
jgi:hypothetical protein